MSLRYHLNAAVLEIIVPSPFIVPVFPQSDMKMKRVEE